MREYQISIQWALQMHMLPPHGTRLLSGRYFWRSNWLGLGLCPGWRPCNDNGKGEIIIF